MKLRTRLFIMLLATSLVSVLVFSMISVSLFISNSKKTIYHDNNDNLEIVKSEISGMLDKHFTTLYVTANNSAIRISN